MSQDQIYAKVIKDSLSPDGHRLTTFEVCFHRFVLAEFNTHRILSKNSASSRAIPAWKQVQKVRENPAVPIEFPMEQKGMQGGDKNPYHAMLRELWIESAGRAADEADRMVKLGLHKSVTNRILEPYLMHTVVVTGTSWQNFFTQRCSPLAQPEIREVATQMYDAYFESDPLRLAPGDWHLPYVSFSEFEDDCGSDWVLATKVSAARSARVSYLTQNGVRDIEEDLTLYERLTTAEPPHWSPLEHVATPWSANQQTGILPFTPLETTPAAYAQKAHLAKIGNLVGWRSLRTEVEAQMDLRTAV